MDGYWTNLALVGLLVLLNAAFAGSEMALVSLREGQLAQLEREGTPRTLRLVRLARDPNRFLATIQIGITLAGFLASAAAAVSLAEPLVPYLSPLGGAAEAVAVAGVTLVLTFVTLVLGELAPKRVAMQRALPWALVAAGPIDLVSRLSRPVVALLGAASNAVVRLFGITPGASGPAMTREELRDLVVSHGMLHAEQREILTGALEIDTRLLRQVMVPRGSVFTLDADLSASQALEALAEAGYSRAPVTRRHHLDHVVGVVHWSNVHRGGDEPVSSVATPALYVPDTMRVADALHRFKTERQQLAVVLDEYGEADGIVTLEDLLEEVVGEIYDETDRDLATVAPLDGGGVVVPGTFPLHDLPDLGIELPERVGGDYTTVSGLVMAELGRVPRGPGEVVHLEGWTVEVLAVARHAPTRVAFRPTPDAGHPPTAPGG
ncbi:hemolysin family protein [Fodinibacter luteus]|uniref:Hemolysin family protein n=1 Tax=Fodinibacter luteus TaxID=552064 RepID=A0ABP8K342_9MICO